MPAERARLVSAFYQNRLRTLRATLERRIAHAYRLSVLAPGGPVELDPRFQELISRTSPLVQAGQGSALLLSAAYLRSLFAEQAGQTVETGDIPTDMVGITKRGLPIAVGMAAIPAMVKAHIGSGHTVPEALELGHYLVQRFADREVVRVADESTDRIARQTREVIGWRGHVQPDACDECRENEGEHGLDIDFYRHGSCRCEREWLVRVSDVA